MFTASAWGTTETIASFSFTKSGSDLPEGWTESTTKSVSRSTGNYYLLSCYSVAEATLTSPEIDFSKYSDIEITFGAGRYGSISGNKAMIEAYVGEDKLGDVSATTTGNVSYKFSYTNALSSKSSIVFKCSTAPSNTNTDGKVGARVYSITIIGTLKGSEVAEPFTVTFDAGTNGTCSTTSLTEASAGAGVTLPSCTANEGYTFVGWSTTENGTTADAGKANDKFEPTEDCTLYAVYKAATVLKGDGTKENPYTLSDVKSLGASEEKAWVIGYIRGSFKSSSELGNAVNTNIALSAAEDGTEFLPVQLPDGTIRSALNVVGNPLNVGRQVKILGTLTTYFSTTGIKSPTDYEFVGGSTTIETVATPTFTPAAGTYTEAQNVTIVCATEGATIYYTTDGKTPTTSSTQYTAAIAVDKTTTIKAIAVKEGMYNSEVATAAYTINLPAVLAGEGEGTEASPYDVTRALDYIAQKQDATVEVYVEGIISGIKSIDVSKFERAQYYISKDGSANSQLYIFNGYYLNGEKFTANDQIKVGDKVVVCGKLTEYSGTKEMDANNKLISIESSGVTPPVVDPVVTVKRAIVAEYNGVYYAATTTVESKKLKAVAVGLSDGKVVFDGEESIVWNWDEENGTFATEDGKYLAQTGTGTDIVVSESGNINWTLDDKNGLVSNSITGRAFIYRNTNVFGNYSASNVGKSDYSGKVQLLPIAEEGLTATIGFTGYATFCPSFDVNVPEGVEVYTVSALNEESVALAQYEGDKIKAGEGVILKGADKSVAGFAKTTDATAIPGNLLVGATTDKALAAGEAYLLANDGGSAAFLLCEAGTLSAGKAYLPANGANAPSLSIVIDDATAIEGLTASKPQNLTTSVYNLAGQKVGADYKGIVIVNGKKLIKK